MYYVLLCSQIAYTEEYEQQRGKGSFPAMITPGYCLAKKAQENASDVSINAAYNSKLNPFEVIECCKCKYRVDLK